MLQVVAEEPTPSGPQAPGKRGSGRNLPVAIASGLTLAGLFLGSVAWSPWAFLTFIAVLVVLALFELDKAFRLQGWRPATPVVIGAGMVTVYGAYSHGSDGQTLGLALTLMGSAVWIMLDSDRTSATASLAASCLMGMWVPFLASFAALLIARPEGRWAIAAAIALAVTSDISAFAFGSKLGRHKMAPSVSPGKTWEGLAGAIFTTLLVGALITARVPGFDLMSALAVALGASVAATIGDLAESMVKRDLGVKDLGGIIPGHGGIMERADGVIFALPVVHLILLALGR